MLASDFFSLSPACPVHQPLWEQVYHVHKFPFYYLLNIVLGGTGVPFGPMVTDRPMLESGEGPVAGAEPASRIKGAQLLAIVGNGGVLCVRGERTMVPLLKRQEVAYVGVCTWH